MKINILISVCIVLSIASCKNGNQVLLSDLNFDSSIFSGSKKDSLHTYCLLATGFFRAPHSKNTDSLISQWLSQHSNAKVISVATHGPTMSDYANSKMTYCWLIDKKDTINNYLVRNGCYPGGTMALSTLKELQGYETLHINKKDYEKFLLQIMAAEEFAQQNKLGIWNKKNEEEQ